MEEVRGGKGKEEWEGNYVDLIEAGVRVLMSPPALYVWVCFVCNILYIFEYLTPFARTVLFLCFLQPTTGMDAVSRKEVMQLIQSLKADAGIILTTHSMEEVRE